MLQRENQPSLHVALSRHAIKRRITSATCYRRDGFFFFTLKMEETNLRRSFDVIFPRWAVAFSCTCFNNPLIPKDIVIALYLA